MRSISLLTASAVFATSALAQLSGTVGPLTTTAEKAAKKICNILDYGGVASVSTDNSAAIASAWSACASGGQVYIPKGDYGFATWLTLKHGNGVSINIEGTIYRTGTGGGNMIFIRDSTDVEIYSATATGAIQAYGYEFHKDGLYGARILRLYHTYDFSIHDIALVDAPQFHLTIDTCENGEIYNVVIHGGYKGGLDGIDVSGSNIWIHDVEVSNKDECVTVKNPSDHLLIESVHCNWSGGCAMGSLSTNTDIHDIEYRNIYTHHSNQMYMIKSNGGNGSVYNVALNTFTGHSNAYTFDMDTAWYQQSVGAGNGISYHDITVEDWHGTCQNGVQRGPIKVLCPAAEPCYDMTFSNFDIWTEAGSKEYQVCANAYGSGGCLATGSVHTAAVPVVTKTITTATSYAYATMANELTAGFDVSSSIPIPTIPASFYPGIAPKSAILSAKAAKRTSLVPSGALATGVSAPSGAMPTGGFAAPSAAPSIIPPFGNATFSATAPAAAAPTSSCPAEITSTVTKWTNATFTTTTPSGADASPVTVTVTRDADSSVPTTAKVPSSPSKPLTQESVTVVATAEASSATTPATTPVAGAATTPATTPAAPVTTPAAITTPATSPSAPIATPVLSWTMSFTNGTAPAASKLVSAPIGTGTAPASTLVTLTRSASESASASATKTFSRSRPSGFRTPPRPQRRPQH